MTQPSEAPPDVEHLLTKHAPSLARCARASLQAQLLAIQEQVVRIDPFIQSILQEHHYFQDAIEANSVPVQPPQRENWADEFS